MKENREGTFFEASHPHYIQCKEDAKQMPMKLHIIEMTQDTRNEEVMSENLLQSLGLTRLSVRQLATEKGERACHSFFIKRMKLQNLEKTWKFN